MSDREDDTAARELLDGAADALYLRSSGDDTNANRVVMALAGHEPVLSDREVLRTIDLVE